MTISLEDKVRELSPAGRKRVLARAIEIRAEVQTWRDLRRARTRAHARLAKELGLTHRAVARLEARCNLLLFTLQRTVEAMGGRLSLVAEFRNRPPVRLPSFSEDEPPPRRAARGRRGGGGA